MPKDSAKITGERVSVIEPPPPRFTLEFFSDIQPNLASGGLIAGLLTESGFSVIAGPHGSRKTFFATDLALSIARGEAWRGRKTRQAPAIYLATEAGPAFRNRVVAYRMHHGLEDAAVPFAILTAPLDLGCAEGDAAALVELIDGASKRFEERVGFVVLDTISRALAGGDENAPKDMGALVRNIDLIREKTGVHVSAVHHIGKDAARGPRGHSLLAAAADTVVDVLADEAAELSIARVTKQRDLPVDGEFAFALRVVEVGRTPDDQFVGSCVVVEADHTSAPALARLSPKMRRALDALNDLVADHGQAAPDTAHYPASAIVVSTDLWREHLTKAGILDRDAGNPREEWRRLRIGLAERGAVAEWNNFVWAVRR